MEAFGDETYLIFVKGTVGRSFDAEHPFATNGCLGGVRYKFPSLVFKQGIIFKIHGLSPSRVFHSLSVGRRFQGRWDGVSSGGVDKVRVKTFGIRFLLSADWRRRNGFNSGLRCGNGVRRGVGVGVVWGG